MAAKVFFEVGVGDFVVGFVGGQRFFELLLAFGFVGFGGFAENEPGADHAVEDARVEVRRHGSLPGGQTSPGADDFLIQFTAFDFNALALGDVGIRKKVTGFAGGFGGGCGIGWERLPGSSAERAE